jgi:ubiquinone biosynthesis protein
LIDFGMIGVVDARTQEQLIDIFLAITGQDVERLVDVLLTLGFTQRRIDRTVLSRDLEHLLAKYIELPLGEIPLGPLLTQAFAIVRRHHLQLPPSMALLLKTLVMDESLGCMLDPTFRLTSLLTPFSRRLMLRRYAPGAWTQHVSRAGIDVVRLGMELPMQLRHILAELERGHLEVGMRPESFEPLVRRFEQLTNRTVLGIIAAAFINGLAVLLLVYHPFAGIWWLGLLFIIGFMIAWSILRPRRK